MASPQVGSLPAKMTFAKIAAMPPPKPTKAPNSSQQDMPAKEKDNVLRASHPPRMTSSTPSANLRTPQTGVGVDSEATPETAGAIEGLAMVKKASLLEKQKTKAPSDESAPGQDSTEDDQSHISGSSTKPPSFDTKSLASVTTFAMDEKESLRPDDSASVQAADDDESVHGLGSNVTVSTEAEVIAGPTRALPRAHINGSSIVPRRFPTITLTNPPRFGDLPMSPVDEVEDDSQPLLAPAVPQDCPIPPIRAPTLLVVPDEKLLDALANPKDRLPLLMLEERLLNFISLTSNDFLDLPPQNSFGRLLAHKLADYYNLQHFIGDDDSSVRLFRTAACTLPTPLSVIAHSIPVGSAPPAGSAAFKIMRRSGFVGRQHSLGGSTAASSSAPSKATSENGTEAASDEGFMSPTDMPKDKSKMTREEREAQYRQARERIFADFQEAAANEATSTGDTSASISRSSSSSGKRQGRNKRTPKDDSFEARSAFVAGYGGMPIVGQQMHYQPSSFAEPSFPTPYSASNNMPVANYGNTPTQSYAGYDPNAAYSGMPNYPAGVPPHYHNPEPWSNPPPTQQGSFYNYPPYSQSSAMYPQHSTPMPSQAMPLYPQAHPTHQQPPPSWTPNQYHTAFQQTPTMQNSQLMQHSQPTPWNNHVAPTNMPPPPTPPYPYGQLPPHSYTNNAAYSAQHPLPGSYASRSLFNPQTRSFVPSNSVSRTGGRGRGKKNNNNGNGNGNQSAQVKNGNGNAQRPPLSSSSTLDMHTSMAAMSLRANPNITSAPRVEEDSSLQQKYGAPAHLPKKPPPSQVPMTFDQDEALSK